MPALADADVLNPLPTKMDVYRTALALRPEIEASKLSVDASKLSIAIAKSGYMPTLVWVQVWEQATPAEATLPSVNRQKNGWNNSLS